MLSKICRRPAMNTLFEIIVDGEDLENNIAAAEAALDEIARIETVLSRFDPASEVSRLNREAHQHLVLISYELLDVLEICERYWQKTKGYFDLTASSKVSLEKKFDFQNVQIDSATRKVFFNHPHVKLDFGAVGKGYALDCAALLLKENGVQNAVLHGGTSSVLAMGNAAQIGLRHPWDITCELDSVTLCNQGLSSSAVFHEGQNASDIINPHEPKQLCDDAACVVVGLTALEAEIFSTALLCMGKERAVKFCEEHLTPDLRVLWMDKISSESGKVGRVTPCAPLPVCNNDGAHGVTRPTIQQFT